MGASDDAFVEVGVEHFWENCQEVEAHAEIISRFGWKTKPTARVSKFRSLIFWAMKSPTSMSSPLRPLDKKATYRIRGVYLSGTIRL